MRAPRWCPVASLGSGICVSRRVWLVAYGFATYIAPDAPAVTLRFAASASSSLARHSRGSSRWLGSAASRSGTGWARRHASDTAPHPSCWSARHGALFHASSAAPGRHLGLCFGAWTGARGSNARRHTGRATCRWARSVGAASMPRPQLLVLGVLPLADLVIVLALRRSVAVLGYGLLGMGVALIPPLVMRGGWSGPPLASPFFAEALWSSRTGLFVWAPLVGVAVLGLLAAPWGRARDTAAGLLGLLVALVFCDGATGQTGVALGERPLVAGTALFLVGLAFFVDRLRRSSPGPGIAHQTLYAPLGPLSSSTGDHAAGRVRVSLGGEAASARRARSSPRQRREDDAASVVGGLPDRVSGGTRLGRAKWLSPFATT